MNEKPKKVRREVYPKPEYRFSNAKIGMTYHCLSRLRRSGRLDQVTASELAGLLVLFPIAWLLSRRTPHVGLPTSDAAAA
jgi:hypothetical protein